MKYVKLYQVVFIHYSDYSKNKVSTGHYNTYGDFVGEDGNPVNSTKVNLTNIKYLNLPDKFIIREDEIEKYRKYGCGYQSLEYIGSIIEETVKK